MAVVRGIRADWPELVKVTFCRNDPTGNIFSIIAKAFFIMDYEHRYSEKKELLRRVNECRTYDCALAVIGEYVTLEEVAA